jgi:hypothetical protein
VRDIWIAVPAWGAHYVETAVRFTVPAAFAALSEAGVRGRFIVHTDAARPFLDVFSGRGHELDIHAMPREAVPNGFHGLTVAHRQVLKAAPTGSIVALLNADIVVSREVFCFAGAVFDSGKRVVASVGHRSLIADEEPPIGASARELLDWCWRNRHPVAEDCVWGRGRTHLPTVLYFEEGGSVVMHGFHLCPVLLLKEREHNFQGTIDDDLLAAYGEDEICVPAEREIAFAELSPREKFFRSAQPLSVPVVTAFGVKRIQPAHLRSFRHAIRVTGDGPVDNSPALAIYENLAAR